MEDAIKRHDDSALDEIAGGITKKFGLKHMQTECDLAFRTVGIGKLKEGTSTDELLQLVAFAAKSVPSKRLGAMTPLLMLSDILEAKSTDECAAIFEFIETNIQVWKSDLFKSSADIHLLRICNDLMKRLSRCIDTALCGRILIFLARYFPLGEKSGLNLPSNFNIENVTVFDSEPDPDLLPASSSNSEVNAKKPSPSAGKIGTRNLSAGGKSETEKLELEHGEVEDGEMAEANAEKIEDPFATLTSVPYDFALYGRFWQLQKGFSQPTDLLDKNIWNVFQINTTAVLDVLSTYKVQRTGHSKPEPELKPESELKQEPESEVMDTDSECQGQAPLKTLISEIVGSKEAGLEDVYFAKYLTSQKLFQLQLSDVQFRRYVLVQFVITLQFLTTPSKARESVRKHLASPMDEIQTKWIERTMEKCYNLMAETHPNGKQFANTVKLILARERTWNSWKNDGCKDFAQIAADKETISEVRKKRTRAFNPTGEIDMGNAELTRLWRQAPNSDATRGAERKFTPTMEEFLVEPVEQLDDTKVWPDRLYNDANWQWRLARHMSLWSNYTALDRNIIKQPFASQLVGNLQLWVRKAAEGFESHKQTLAEIVENKKKRELQIEQEAQAKMEALKKQQEMEEMEKKQAENDAKKAAMASRAKYMAMKMEEEQAPLVTEEQLEKVSKSIAPSWALLAQKLEWSDDALKAMHTKRGSADECALNVLSSWVESNGEKATVKKLSNLLLDCNLVTPEIISMLQSDQPDEKLPFVAALSPPKKQPISEQAFKRAETKEGGATMNISSEQKLDQPVAKRARKDSTEASGKSIVSPAKLQRADSAGEKVSVKSVSF